MKGKKIYLLCFRKTAKNAATHTGTYLYTTLTNLLQENTLLATGQKITTYT